MTKSPKLLRLKKRIIALSYNLKLTARHRKFHSENTGGLARLSFRKYCPMTITLYAEYKQTKYNYYIVLE